MQKPQSLREHLVAANPKLREDPEKLLLFVDTGSIESTAAGSLSFGSSYTCTILITDYAGDPTAVFVPLIAWLREYQSDLLANPDKRKNGIKFEVDFNNKETFDLSIEIELTESTIVVKNEDDVHIARAGKEVQPTPGYSDQEFWTLQAEDGSLLAEWYTPT